MCYAPVMKKNLFHFQKPVLKIFSTALAFVCLCFAGLSALSATKQINLEAETSNDETVIEPGNPLPDLPPIDTPAETWKHPLGLMIYALNPGYTVDGSRDVGEFIELRRTTDTPLSLAGYSLRYVNSSGASSTLADFIDGSTLAGETLLLRLARSSAPGQSDLTYTTTLAMSSGRLELLYRDEVIDSVCWSGKDGCLAAFKSARPTSLLRNLETGEFAHIEEYEPQFDPNASSLILPDIAEPSPETPGVEDQTTDNSISAKCGRLEFTEILSYYDDNKSEQFIELYNPTDETINLSSCNLRYKKKTYSLSGTIAPENYYAYYPSSAEKVFTLTKNPNTSNVVDLVGNDAALIDSLSYNHGQKKATSFARFYDENGEEFWQTTYAPTPGTANILQEFRSCPEGKIINPATGNCVKINGSTSVTKACPAGQYRNPLTGRCKKSESTTKEQKPCAEGYERNPETNRCRKITKTNSGADYPLVPKTYTSQSTFVAAGIIILVALVGVTYIVLQFRHEIVRMGRKTCQRLHDVRKDIVARTSRFYRNKKP